MINIIRSGNGTSSHRPQKMSSSYRFVNAIEFEKTHPGFNLKQIVGHDELIEKAKCPYPKEYLHELVNIYDRQHASHNITIHALYFGEDNNDAEFMPLGFTIFSTLGEADRKSEIYRVHIHMAFTFPDLQVTSTDGSTVLNIVSGAGRGLIAKMLEHFVAEYKAGSSIMPVGYEKIAAFSLPYVDATEFSWLIEAAKGAGFTINNNSTGTVWNVNADVAVPFIKQCIPEIASEIASEIAAKGAGFTMNDDSTGAVWNTNADVAVPFIQQWVPEIVSEIASQIASKIAGFNPS